MALIPERVNSVTVEVNGSTYELKEMISGYERRKLDTAGMLVQMTAEQFQSRRQMDDLMYMKPNLHQKELDMLQVYLVSWSHKENLTAANLRRLPPRDWDALIDKINELQKAQYGAAEDSDVGKLSMISSDS